MPLIRSVLAATCLVLLQVASVRAEQTIRVAYAGSMAVVMDRFLGPDFAKANNAQYQGIGQGSYGLARLLAAKRMQSDVFVSVTPGPMKLLEQAGLVRDAAPVAATEMVIAYSPKSRFATQLAAAAAGREHWWTVLAAPGLHFGRTDPQTDPQGQNIIFTMLLAERFYHAPDLARTILGPDVNTAQIFTEPSLLSRLESGQLDASSGYRSAAVSHYLPFVPLPNQINLADPGMDRDWYSTVGFAVRQSNGQTKTVHPQPLVFYAAVLTNAPDPDLGRKFVAYLNSPDGQATLRQNGYAPPRHGNS